MHAASNDLPSPPPGGPPVPPEDLDWNAIIYGLSPRQRQILNLWRVHLYDLLSDADIAIASFLDSGAQSGNRRRLRTTPEKIHQAFEMISAIPLVGEGLLDEVSGRNWIELEYRAWPEVSASIRCPQCQFIVHLKSIERFGGRPRASGKELEVLAECENGYRFTLVTEDHSGQMSLGVGPDQTDDEREED